MLTGKRIVIAAVVLVLLGVAAFRLVHRSQGKGPGGGASEAIPVEVSAALRGDVEDILTYTGDIRGSNEARVYPRAPGKLLRKIKDVGDAVKKDEALALVDRDEPALKFSPSDVRSPLTGILTRYYVDIGEAVLPQTPIAQVAEMERVKVVIQVPEQDLPRVRLGQTARILIDAFPDLTPQGTVSRISQSLDTASRTAEVEIALENPGRILKPGLFARVNLVLDVHTGAITIPRTALSETMEKQSFVFIVVEGKAEKRPIRVGILRMDRAEVVEGLSEGAQVVTLGRHLLTDGARVEVYRDNEGAK